MSYKLELYYFPECPYCQRVLSTIYKLHIADSVEMRDIHEDNEARRTLVDVGGKQQVPCLFIDGEPPYESPAIVEWLQEHFAPKE